MVNPRVEETGEGIQDKLTVDVFDRFQRRFRDKRMMETASIIKSGITGGTALEVGPGPGYLGLEWLKKTSGTSLKGLEISPEMIKVAERNAAEYGFEGRASYVLGDASVMPFEDGAFDAVFSNGSLHEWADPEAVLSEVFRVLKPGGRYFVSDLRRDTNPLILLVMKAMTKPREIRPGLKTSINAAYTRDELLALISMTALDGGGVRNSLFGLELTGQKA